MGRKNNGTMIKCKYCDKLFYVIPSKLKKGMRYCSFKCFKKDNPPWNKGLTKSEDKRLMSISLKSREQMHREYTNGTRDKNKIVSKAHEAVIKKGLDKFNSNPTKMVGKRGYCLIYIPQRGWVKEHHWVWEQHNGNVPKGMILHHIDGNRLNNKLDNLELMNPKEHGIIHFEHTKQYLEKNWDRAKDAKRNSKGQFIRPD